ncbi:competence/damage-inducible protein A [Dellaglioa sp. P0083]|uniref:competence/damage-inducible protein A n=1 Tax=Dellaglioa kimchii TaxID=3344667 RepID=UPI0038D40845
MHAEIIAVGTEILLGQIVNTNSAFLAEKLADLGVNVFYQTVVGDNEERMLEAIELASKRNDLVILSGGLGPTEDDLTKQMVAKFLNEKLVENKDAMSKIEDHFTQTGRQMTENNKLQALYIEGSKPIKNHAGMAVGDFYKGDSCDFLLLPGPPKELKTMFNKEVEHLLKEEYNLNSHLESKVLRFYGIGESKLVTELKEIIDSQTNPTIAPYAKTNEVTLRITASATDDKSAVELINEMEIHVLSKVGDYFYGYGDDNSLKNVVVTKLIEKDLSISASESLTAGLFQSTLAEIPGVSKIYDGGYITYANTAKSDILGISPEDIKKYGVVSEETAKQMAQQTQNKMKTDIAISFTGVAGPDELENQKAGTVWIGLAIKNSPIIAKQFHFAGNRETIRQRSVLSGLKWIFDEINE